jgi:hypothetical protein
VSWFLDIFVHKLVAFVIMLSGITPAFMLSNVFIVMLGVVILNVIMLHNAKFEFMLIDMSLGMLCAIILNVIILYVVAP